jgi:hypothetical protein
MQQSAVISSPCDTMSHPLGFANTPVISGPQTNEAEKIVIRRDETAQATICIGLQL